MIVRELPLRHSSSRALAAALPRFNLVALHWQGSGVPWFRARTLAGAWTAWQPADDDWGRKGAWRMQTNPQWVGPSDSIQYRLRGRVKRLRAYFLWSLPESLTTRRLAIAGSPLIVPRSAWGADEEIRRAAPRFADAIRVAVVHHTVNTNTYAPSDSPAIVQAIERYHVLGNGWNDIGYNFLVDRYGQIFEGRYGGIDRNVIGAHTLGFNTGSVGVAVIGTFTKAALPVAAKASLEQFLAWRLDVAHLDPAGTTSVTSGGNSKYRAGAVVSARAISGHRNFYPTDCPGNALYGLLPGITKDVAALGGPKLFAPVLSGKLGGPIRFTGRLSASLPWTVTVTDAAGAVVASGSGVGTTIDWTWDATLVRPATYVWTMSAGPTVRPARGAIGGTLPTASITDVRASPAVTSTTSQITYTLAAPATVSATLVDANGLTVAPLFSETKPAGKQAFTFTVAPTVLDGVYTIRFVAVTADGRQATASVLLQIDRSVIDFSASPAAISPNGDGIQDTVAVSFDLARPAAATLALTRQRRTLVTIATGSYAAAVPFATSWDGTSNGSPVPDGTYDLSLQVGAVTRTLPLTIDRLPPVLRPISWRHLRFQVDGPATVTLSANGQSYVKRVKAAGRFYFWLRTPPMRYVVTAQDAAGNVAKLTRT
jgi:flagellar hook assembly protein FlgD